MRAAAALALALALGSIQAPLAVPAALTPAPVRIDVVVTGASGRPVSDLGAKDFEVLEDGTARPLDSARFITQGSSAAVPIAAAADAESETSAEGGRIFGIFSIDATSPMARRWMPCGTASRASWKTSSRRAIWLSSSSRSIRS